MGLHSICILLFESYHRSTEIKLITQGATRLKRIGAEFEPVDSNSRALAPNHCAVFPSHLLLWIPWPNAPDPEQMCNMFVKMIVKVRYKMKKEILLVPQMALAAETDMVTSPGA